MKIAPAVLIAAVLAVVAAGCGGEDPAAPAPLAAAGGSLGKDVAALAAATEPAASPAGITVTGTGSVTAVPDVADWSFGVQADAGSAAEALRTASASARRIVDAVRGAGVERRDIRTEQVSVYPRMSADGQTVEGFSASSSVSVVVRDIGRSGDVVDGAVTAGANQVSGPSLRVSDDLSRYTAALDAAFDDARARAEAIAERAGVSLGAPLAIVEGGGFGGGPVPLMERAAADAAVQIEPGSQQVTATLTVTFAIG